MTTHSSLHEQRETIMGAARMAFIEHRYSGASVEMIAGRSGVSVGTVYLRFGSKRRLYIEAMLEGHIEHLAEGLEGMGLRDAWDALIRWAEENGERARALAMAYRETPSGNQITILQNILDIAATRQVIADERFAKTEPKKLAEMLWVLFMGMILHPQHLRRWVADVIFSPWESQGKTESS